MMWHGTFAVFRFELLRTLTVSRIAVWLLLTSFPIFIVGVIRYNEEYMSPIDIDESPEPQPYVVPLANGGTLSLSVRRRGLHRVAKAKFELEGKTQEFDNIEIPTSLTLQDDEQFRAWRDKLILDLAAQTATTPARSQVDSPSTSRNIPDVAWGLMFFGLIPEVITLFGLLLWVTPLVQTELEGRTWIYLAVRPRGRASTLLGKYLTAITWTALSGWVSVTVCVLIAQPQQSLRLWCTMLALITLACLAYGALYSVIGVLLQRRAMVIAVAYTLIFEFLVSFVPAVINQFTVQYRLRNLLVDFMDWRSLFSKEAMGVLLGEQPAWLHVLVLIGVTILLLAFAMQVIQRKEYATAEEA